ncbi:MAG: division/cell wall cluster transcriptional repressor MraZ [Bacteroidales bacterium]|jgi:MraZ protein|nr:division/cell wall cluster transcriptional repressor MraZ [Bacteroidales bacterium]MDD3665886.1 division/cell wall cluster transcriptional repressor MraZ [Bacteroidales bacterium]
MLNFIGVHECKADDKGRIMFPSALRKQMPGIMDQGFVVKRSVFDRCLELFPMSEWNKEMARIDKLNRFVKKNIEFIRKFTAGVKTLELDASGRFLIPKDLMNYAQLQKEVVLAAMGTRIEIWDKEKYEAAVDDSNDDFGALAEEVMGGILSEETT